MIPPTMPSAPVPGAPVPGSFPILPVNHTIYVNNLNEKIKKDELKKSLFHVMSQFGQILEIQAEKSLKKRGQAWIVFSNTQSAGEALKEMQSFNFYGKPMRVQYAKVKSDIVAKKDGTYVKRVRKKLKSKSKKKKKSKKTKTTDKGDQKEDTTPPNKVLMVENLPTQCNTAMLSMLFHQYAGFKDASMVPERPGIAFVEFDESVNSTLAKDSLQNFQITATHCMKISFAKI